jgi:ribokinase
MGNVVVAGSANLDLVVRQPRRAEPGETMFGSDFHSGPGGKGLNQAVAAARAGAEVAFVGAVGRDAFGDRLRGDLEREGIDTAGLRTVDAPTGIAAISVTDDGENTIVVVSGANAVDDLSAADRAAIDGASVLVVQLERPLAYVRAALEQARAAGVRSILTPAPVVDGAADLVALADVLVPNEGEAAALSGESDAVAAATRLSSGGGTVIVTRGSKGAVVATAGRVVGEVAPRPARVVDTTGAGDTFVGVLAAGLAAGADLDAALADASVAASLAVERPGAAEAMPTAAEIAAARA